MLHTSCNITASNRMQAPDENYYITKAKKVISVTRPGASPPPPSWPRPHGGTPPLAHAYLLQDRQEQKVESDVASVVNAGEHPGKKEIMRVCGPGVYAGNPSKKLLYYTAIAEVSPPSHHHPPPPGLQRLINVPAESLILAVGTNTPGKGVVKAESGDHGLTVQRGTSHIRQAILAASLHQ